MNDGLALPAVLAFTARARRAGEDDFVWWQFVLQDVTLGLRLRAGRRAARLAADAARAAGGPRRSPTHQKSLYALGTAFATYGVAVGLPPAGQRADRRVRVRDRARDPAPRPARDFEARSDDIVEIVKLGVFVVFGSLLTLDGLFGDGWAAVAIVAVTLLVARPVAIVVALAGTGVPAPRRRSWPGSGPRAWRR